MGSRLDRSHCTAGGVGQNMEGSLSLPGLVWFGLALLGFYKASLLDYTRG